MGLFVSKAEKEREEFEISKKIRNSECAQLFSNVISSFLQEGDEHYQWLLTNSRERMYVIEVFRDGVRLKRVEVNRHRLRETGTYDVDGDGWGFGVSGYADLPNDKYLKAFKTFLFDEIKKNCPNIRFVDQNAVMLAESAKQGW